MTRLAQACDRCRAKKSKCDGMIPACSACAAVGFKCIVSDKLLRRAFPKGYTETLEERVRQLETENNKLQGLVKLRDEQLAIMNNTGTIVAAASEPPPLQNNLEFANPHLVLPTHEHNEGCQCCSDPNALHERPVSLAGSVYDPASGTGSVFSDEDDDTNSLLSFDDRWAPNREVSPAPGAFAAATAIEKMQKRGSDASSREGNEENRRQLLTALVAASIPRTTEETLFVPTLLARIGHVYGFSSVAARLTATSIASLKDLRKTSPPDDSELLNLIMNHESPELKHSASSRFLALLSLPRKMDLDFYLATYFLEWHNACPIISKAAFLENYPRLWELLSSGFSSKLPQYGYELPEKLGAIIVLVVSLALLSKKHTQLEATPAGRSAENSPYLALVAKYDNLIHEFIKPNCILTKYCSLQSLQILTLGLQYFLATGDLSTCYELRGRVITMAQQLRLHRCPAAVLGMSREMNDRNLQTFMQGERRILFWCIYLLDTYASLNLGVPRLLKDYEIECAMPFSGSANDDRNESILIINNTRLTIFGKVPQLSLAVMQYCKVLGNIMDSIFTRSDNTNSHDRAVEKDRILDCWRRDLPDELRFEIDVNGFSLRDSSNNKLNGGSDGTNWAMYPSQQLLLVFLYYHAKVLIFLPIISKYGRHHNVGLSLKEKFLVAHGDISSAVLSMSLIQQSAIQMLELLKALHSQGQMLPIPINVVRQQARFSILVAKGSLDYTKGGPLHYTLKKLLVDTLAMFRQEADAGIPSALTDKTVSFLETCIFSVLGINISKPGSATDLRRRIMNNGIFDRKAHESVASGSAWRPLSNESGDSNGEYMDYATVFDDILNFDPFKAEQMPNHFVTDGSLGLVPFLDENDPMKQFLKVEPPDDSW